MFYCFLSSRSFREWGGGFAIIVFLPFSCVLWQWDAPVYALLDGEETAVVCGVALLDGEETAVVCGLS